MVRLYTSLVGTYASILLFADRCEDGVGCYTENGRHRTLLRRITDCYEETVGRPWRTNVLFSIK